MVVGRRSFPIGKVTFQGLCQTSGEYLFELSNFWFNLHPSRGHLDHHLGYQGEILIKLTTWVSKKEQKHQGETQSGKTSIELQYVSPFGRETKLNLERCVNLLENWHISSQALFKITFQTFQSGIGTRSLEGIPSDKFWLFKPRVFFNHGF